MSKREYLRSLFNDTIMPFILKMIETIINKLMDGLSFRKDDDQNYIAYNAG